MDDYFREVCTRNAVLSKLDQEKLYQHLINRIENNGQVAVQAPIQNKKNQKTKNNQNRQVTQRKVYSTMTKENENMLYFKVLTQSILSTGEMSLFTRDAYLKSAYYCLEHSELKQSYISLTRLAREIYPTLLRTSEHDQNLSIEYEQVLGLYTLFIIVQNDESDQSITSFLRSNPNLVHIKSVKFSLKVMNAISSKNYYRFFKLYNLCVDDRSKSLMQTYLKHSRVDAFQYIQKSYYSIPASYVSKLLLFDNCEEFLNWLNKEVEERNKRHKDKLPVKLIDVSSMEVIEDKETIVFKRPPNNLIIR
ncbi:hypothetical protein AKO1_008288 [Acrasis kona]|uniref:SAC3/GANP/THP3 conserved domain-containing protein n=1 Tax=Acrasis kona TaxID=1008807 RepID=A0AAW2YME7_9EUKA